MFNKGMILTFFCGLLYFCFLGTSCGMTTNQLPSAPNRTNPILQSILVTPMICQEGYVLSADRCRKLV